MARRRSPFNASSSATRTDITPDTILLVGETCAILATIEVNQHNQARCTYSISRYTNNR
ncbi:hypothetical protein [Limnobaculum parvum]|uniref:hypothetical protein n=1 Tax=Limnobaculum parvum TaxID=2172103 RepID=UPI0013002AE3|nr:hypothetical protein [Limnobaculum parvum]